MSKVKTTVGDRVKLKNDNVGYVRFVGELQGKKGVFYGVELDKAKGKNNGTLNKTAYFKCAKKKGSFVQKGKILKSNNKDNKEAPRVTVGDKVKVKKAKCTGTVRFVGTPGFKPGVWYGIELDKPKGKNNGTVKDRWYFTCKAKYGTFVQASGLDLGDASAKKKTKKSKKKEEPKKKKVEEKKVEEKYEKGDRIMIKPNRKGQVKYIGESKEFGPGVWYGVRLTESRGDCDGEWKDVRFFQCPENFGVFVQKLLIVKKIDGDFDFMNEEEKYEEEARLKAQELKKEKDKLRKLREKFNEVDTDGSQTIDRKEFNQLASEIFGSSKQEANALFKEVDANSSGLVSFAEFDKWIDSLGGIEEVVEADDDNKDADPEPEPEPEPENDENNDGGDDANDAADDADAPADDGADNADNADAADDDGKVDDENADADANENDADNADANNDDADGGGDYNADGADDDDADADAAGDDDNANDDANDDDNANADADADADADEADDADADADADAGGDENDDADN